MQYQFGCGISNMVLVGAKKQDFWPRINIRTEKIKKMKKNPSMNDSSSKIGQDFRKLSGSKIEARK